VTDDPIWKVIAFPLLKLAQAIRAAEEACEEGYAAALEHGMLEEAGMWARARELLEGLPEAWESGVYAPREDVR
jgi:hypothetical protein